MKRWTVSLAMGLTAFGCANQPASRPVLPSVVAPPPPDAAPSVVQAAPPDRDGDGIPDEDDACPDEPETVNDCKDDDGCPDKWFAHRRWAPKIEDKIYFPRNSAVIPTIAEPTLDAVAAIMVGNPEILKVEVQGFVADNERSPNALGSARATAVATYIVEHGVAANRLLAINLGTSKPFCRERCPICRDASRRVQFSVLDLAPPPMPGPRDCGRVM